MLIGYVSDERYVALADVAIEFTDAQGRSFEARSRASGSVHAEVPEGDYLVTLQKSGFGEVTVSRDPEEVNRQLRKGFGRTSGSLARATTPPELGTGEGTITTSDDEPPAAPAPIPSPAKERKDKFQGF